MCHSGMFRLGTEAQLSIIFHGQKVDYNREVRTLNTYLYHKDKGLTEDHTLEELKGHVGQEDCYFWVDLEGGQIEEIKNLGQIFDFHPLTVEDCINVMQRPKVDIFDNYLFVVVKTPNLQFEKGEMRSLELDMFIGVNYVITVHPAPIKSIQTTISRVEEGAAIIMGKGSDYLAHTIIDLSVDNYLSLLEKVDEDVERIEDEVFEEPDQELLNEISQVRRDLLYLQRVIGPQRETIGRLSWGEVPFIKESQKIYFRDVQDHLARINDLIANYREIIGGARDMYLTVISNKMNEIMKTLTIIATIFIPLTFIAGVYGMNFAHMPELDWSWGYYGVLGIMGGIIGGMIYYFKRKNWIGG